VIFIEPASDGIIAAVAGDGLCGCSPLCGIRTDIMVSGSQFNNFPNYMIGYVTAACKRQRGRLGSYGY